MVTGSVLAERRLRRRRTRIDRRRGRRASLRAALRSHRYDWVRLRLRNGRCVRGWLLDLANGFVCLCDDLYHQDICVRVPIADIRTLHFSRSSLRWVVPWQL